MTLWFTSDEHYGHAAIIGYSNRPFADVAAMNAGLIAQHNARVQPGDKVWHLGDFALRDTLVAEILPQLHGIHHLVVGNHDRCHPSHGRWRRSVRQYERWGFHSVQERAVVLLAGLGYALLCHLPLRHSGETDETLRPKYNDHRPQLADLQTLGAAHLLHGHVHERWKRRGPMINCGVDVWGYAPVSEAELVAFVHASVDPAPHIG